MTSFELSIEASEISGFTDMVCFPKRTVAACIPAVKRMTDTGPHVAFFGLSCFLDRNRILFFG